MKDTDYTFCELRDREIVNVTDGKKLGRMSDIAFDAKGKIIGIIVPGEKKFLKNITGNDNIFIPWCCILKIGDDVILVDLHNGGPTERNKPCDMGRITA